MPLLGTSPAAGGDFILGNEYRMPSHECLLLLLKFKKSPESGIDLTLFSAFTDPSAMATSIYKVADQAGRFVFPFSNGSSE
jgi:hypothetical protein